MINDDHLSLKEIYMNNPFNRIRDDFLSDLHQFTFQKPTMSVTDLIKSTIERFAKITFHYDSKQNKIYINAIAKLFLKIKQIQILNIFIAHYKFIQSILHDMISSYSTDKPIAFSFENDFIITPLFTLDSDRNIIDLSMKIQSNSTEKLQHITSFIDYHLNYCSNRFAEIHLIFGALPQGHIVSIIQHNRCLIKDNTSSIDMRDYRAKMNPHSLSESLICCEKEIRLNFKYTKRHIKSFKQSFIDLKAHLLLNEEISKEVMDMYPFGSVTQCTQNIFSDLEITLLTTAKDEDALINLIHKEISDKDDYYSQIYIRKTKRTILVTLMDNVNDVKIELNLNNVFGILNSSLIRNYLLSDSRVLIMVNEIKYWSKSRKINGNYKGYLSSYCFSLMVIYFLQRVSPPILPVVASKNKLRSVYVKGKHYYLEKKMISDYPLKSSDNNDPVSLLILKFFLFYYDYFKTDCYCIDITSQNEVFRYYEVEYMNYFMTSQRSAYCFIDPFDYSYNPGAYFVFNSTPYENFRKVLKQTIDDILLRQTFLQAMEA